MWLSTVVGTVLFFFGNVETQFQPGCSFSSGQCIYNVKLGQAQSCDAIDGSSQSGSSTHSSSGGCSCDEIQNVGNDVTSLRTTVSDLQHAVDKLYSEMNISRSALTQTQDLLHAEQQHAAELLVTLNSKEKILNQTKAELANVLLTAKHELDNLRQQLINASRQLSVCQGNAGLATTTPTVYSGYSTFYCGFESHQGLCNFKAETGSGTSTSSHIIWNRETGRPSSSTGPNMDHTYETPTGHYMTINALYISEHTSSHDRHTIHLISPSFDPSPNYCIRFWYNMHGSDVQPLKVYAKINSGLGYPIKVITPVNSVDWKLGEVEIDSEYTANRFQIVFEGSTDAHYTYVYHSGSGSSKQYHDQYGNVAIDDVYVYNTTCKEVPVCPPGAYMYQNSDNTTSCYTFHTTPMSWYDAIDECKKHSYNGHLASVTDQKEHDYLVRLIQSDIGLMTAGQSGFYLSGNDETSENHFVWTNNGTPTTLSYSNWYPGQPNNVASNQDCLLMQYPDADYQWGDVACSEKHPYICETRY